jgi:predicted outer membrane protein
MLRIGGRVKLSPSLWLLIGAVSVAPSLAAQASGDGSLNEAALYSLYAKRHVTTIAFADLAVARGVDGDVRKAAENLVRVHREARERLERIATERHLTLTPPEHDMSTVLLERARASLESKAGRWFDSTWVSLAHDWLSTLILDNNRVVKARIGAEMQPVAQEHTTWLFHQSADIDKLRRKFK